jgi:predicted dehydrogenase
MRSRALLWTHRSGFPRASPAEPVVTPGPASTPASPSVDYRPSFPRDYAPGIGIVGCGAVAATWHLPAYEKYGVDVVGVYDPAPEATNAIQERFPFVRRVFGSLEELLADPRIEVVDIATRPDVRVELIRAAVHAGKHVLAQKPLALDPASARDVVEEAEHRGIVIAVNQNGRWWPPWRIATQLIAEGAIGNVVAVTHLLDRQLPPLVGTHFDEVEHFMIFDFFVHWIDISRCWLGGKAVSHVRAREYRPPNQPRDAKAAWGAWVEIACEDGASAMVRTVGDAQTKRPSCLFWVHGSEGTIRGSVLLGSDFVELERDGVTTQFTFEGAGYPDGFAGTLGELVTAISQSREPFNSARHNLLSLRLTLAACRSAEESSRPVALDEIAG